MKILSLFRKKEKPSFVINIPEPCSEDWNKMDVVDDMHRHCGACERTLVDFSVMSDDELVIFFKQNNGKVCGRFRKDQTNRNLTQLPEKTSKAKWWKAAALLPLSLFSKNADAQQLPDSLQTKQTPLVVLPDSAGKCEPLVVDWGIAPPEVVNWKWNFDDDVYLMGIPPPPIVTVGYIVTLSVNPAFTADTTTLVPHADSNVGAKATAIEPKKIPHAAEGAGFAGNLKAIHPKKEE
jgi:hypothetical protein